MPERSCVTITRLQRTDSHRQCLLPGRHKSVEVCFIPSITGQRVQHSEWVQYWKVVNVDKREQVRNRRRGLKLQEMLNNRIGEELLDLLKVPSLLRPCVNENSLGASKSRQ